MMKAIASLLFVGYVLACAGSAVAQEDYFSNWPPGVAPKEVGKRVAEHFVTSPHQYISLANSTFIHHSEVVTWYGSLTFATLTHDDALRAELIKRFEPLMPGGTEEKLIPKRHHVDDSIFGVVPLEIGLETKDAEYLTYGQSWTDRQ